MLLGEKYERLYRVVITEKCPSFTRSTWRNLFREGGTYYRTPHFGGKDKIGYAYGFFPVGLTGWVVSLPSEDGKKYFGPDPDNENIYRDPFLAPDEPDAYFPYKLIEGHYKVIE